MKRTFRTLISIASLACAAAAHAQQQQQTLGGILANALGNSIKSALSGKNAGSAPRGQQQGAETGPAAADLTAEGYASLPVYSLEQSQDRYLLLHGIGRLEYRRLIGPSAGPVMFDRSEMPAEYVQQVNSVNHQDSFAEQDFKAFAQPYVNWAENYLLAPQIFVSQGDMPVQLDPYDPATKSFTLRYVDKHVDSNYQRLPLVLSEADSRALEGVRATHGVATVFYLSQERREPFRFKILGAEFFDTHTLGSIMEVTFSSASPEEVDFIKSHGMHKYNTDIRTLVKAGTAATSLAEPHARAAAAPAAGKTLAAASTKACQPGEDLLKAVKVGKSTGGYRVDYVNVATGAKNWTNMTDADIKAMGVKVGGQFCESP